MSLLGRITICPGSWRRAQLLAPSAESACSLSDLWHKVTLQWQHGPKKQHPRQGVKMASHKVEIELLNQGTGPAGFLTHNSTPRTRFQEGLSRRKEGSAMLPERRSTQCWKTSMIQNLHDRSDLTHVRRQGENTAKRQKNNSSSCGKEPKSGTGAQRRKPPERSYQWEKTGEEVELELSPKRSGRGHQRRTQGPLVVQCNRARFRI